jgi:hypothetical protein
MVFRFMDSSALNQPNKRANDRYCTTTAIALADERFILCLPDNQIREFADVLKCSDL